MFIACPRDGLEKGGEGLNISLGGELLVAKVFYVVPGEFVFPEDKSGGG